GKAAPGMWTHCAVRFLADSADGALRALHSVPTRRSSDLALYRLTAQMAPGRLPALTDAQVEALVSGYGKVPAPSANDGMVPTLSQVWGRVIHIARADHLDVMGYFGDPSRGPTHVDWLVTRSGFDRTRFRAVWGAVARTIAESARRPSWTGARRSPRAARVGG